MSSDHFKIVIVGGGAAGITVAARLANKIEPSQIVIIDPTDMHYYQPLWTLVGRGLISKEKTGRMEQSVIPKGVHFIQEAVTSFEPENNAIFTNKEKKIHYDYLVVAPGLSLNWDHVKGLKEAIGKEGVVSNYSYEYVDNTWDALRHFKGGNAIFTQPNTPIKCGGAPQKIMYLAEEYFREKGVRKDTSVIFYTPKSKIFPVEKYAHALSELIEERDIDTRFNRYLVEIQADQKLAIFEHVKTKEKETIPYDMIHVTPPMSAPSFIKNSPLSDDSGWVDIDPYTLQHHRYKNIFSLGDVINAPSITKTGAGVRKQAPVVVSNLLKLMNGQPITEKYNGYTSCPLVTSKNKVILSEFNYDLEPQESFPFNQAKERTSMYLLKRYVLPEVYWKGMLKGRL